MTTPGPVENRYAAPQAPLVPGRTGGPGIGLGWHLAWAAVFGANLIVPLLFGWDTTRGAGRVGLVLGIALMFSLGLFLCYCTFRDFVHFDCTVEAWLSRDQPSRLDRRTRNLPATSP